MPLPFDFVVLGTPRSVQSKSASKQRWKAQVSAAAQVHWVGAPVTGEVQMKVVYYFIKDPLDTDNMLKPIQDAMNGIIYVDDSQVTDITAGKRRLDGSFRVRGLSPRLAEGFVDGGEFVHIQIQKAPDPEELI